MKRIAHKIDSFLVQLGAKSRLAASLYYVLRGKFSREQQAVLAGKVAYKRSLSDPSINSSLLRRNIHRLEKGILMRPRRVPFGLNYIEETVDIYCKAIEAQTDLAELAWAHDVLGTYFDITPPDPAVDPLRARFKSTRRPICEPGPNGRRSPYRRQSANRPHIPYEEFLKLARYRRSVRWYLPQTVPRDVIERAIEVASYSPTACNRQPYEFRVFDDPKLVGRVLSIPMGTGGFGHQVPAVAVVVGKQRNYPNERDRHLIYVDGALAIMSFVYALEVQNLASCCINWPDVEALERRMTKLLGLSPDERPIMLVAFGYPDPDGLVADSTKKPVDILCKYNQYDDEEHNS